MCLFDLNINRTSSFAVVMNTTATRGRCLTRSIYAENSKSAFGKHFTFGTNKQGSQRIGIKKHELNQYLHINGGLDVQF